MVTDIETEEKLLRYGRWVLGISTVFTCGVFFVVMFFGGLLSPAIDRQFPGFFKYVCYPLGHPASVIADEKGQIYVGLGLYNRVQVYDRTGEFRFGFQVKGNSGAFQLRWDSDRQLNIVTARGDRLMVYDHSGSLLSSSKADKELYSATRADNLSGFVDGTGNQYRIGFSLITYQVVKTDSNGKVILEIQSPILLWIFTSIFNLVPLVVLNLAMRLSLLYLKANCRRVVDGTHLFPNGIIRRKDVLLRYKRTGLDVILTKFGVCWAGSIWEPYECVSIDDLDIRIKKRWVRDLVIIKSKSSLSMEDVRFQANNPGKWISTVNEFKADGST